MKQNDELNDLSYGLSCPIPINEYPTVTLAHGGGGKLGNRLIRSMFLPQFDNEILAELHDGAALTIEGARLAFSTDSYVVNPIFFPGGSIGELAVNGTVNDLAMCGARPLFLSAAFIVEEGMPMNDLWRVVLDMQRAAKNAGVKLVTGDTKVVDRGKGDSIFINTSGIGVIPAGREMRQSNVKAGDVVVLSGRIAEHGIAIMSVREGLEFDAPVKSDTAPLNGLTEEMFATGARIKVMRDPTRGGVASALNEIAEKANVGIHLKQEAIPIADEVKGACEILGFDPLYVANEGKLIAFAAKEDAEKLLAAMRTHPLGVNAAIIGEAVAERPGTVVMESSIGGTRVVDMLSGEQLPRIC